MSKPRPRPRPQPPEGVPKTPDDAHRRSPRQTIILAGLLLAVGTVVVITQWPVLSAQALFVDDQQYVSINQLVRNPSWNSTARFFGEVLKPSTVQGYYQPLAMTSLMLDWASGATLENLTPFHRTNLTLHVINALLIIVFLHAVFGNPWIAALVGLLWGVHPMTIEVTAWLAERKTLLATLFSLCCLISYVRWTRRPKRWLFALALLLFVMALMSKPTSTPLPVLLLLLDCWPLRRLSLRALLEKIPFLIIAGISSVITVVSQARSGAVALPTAESPWRIPLTLCHNIVFYIHKIVWPSDLTPWVSIPEPFDIAHPRLLAGVIGTTLLIALLLISLRWTRAPAVAWVFFFVAIFPTMGVIGFTQVIASDKYAYLPAVGFLLLLTWALCRLWTAPPRVLPLTAWRVGVAALALCLAGLEARAARHQITYWRTTETLYERALRFAPDQPSLHQNLGSNLATKDRLDEAMQHYRQALEINPNLPNTCNSMGNALARLGRYEEAMSYFRRAIELDPDLADPHSGMGGALIGLDRLDEAWPYLEKALQLDPYVAETHLSMGVVLSKRGDLGRAIGHFRTALRIRPESVGAHYNMGLALAMTGDLDRAAIHFAETIHLAPTHANAYLHLGQIMLQQGRVHEAIRVYEEALRAIPPNDGSRARLQIALQEALNRRSSGPQP